MKQTETPDTEQFQIEIRDLDSNVYATSSTVSINDTSTVDPFTIYETNFALPMNTDQGSSWLSSGTVTVTNGKRDQVIGCGLWIILMGIAQICSLMILLLIQISQRGQLQIQQRH